MIFALVPTWLVFLSVLQDIMCGTEGREVVREDKIGQSEEERREQLSSITEAIVNGWMRYIEVWISVDDKLLNQFNRDKGTLIQRCMTIISEVNKIMRPLMIQVVLKEVEFLDYRSELNTNNHIAILKNFSPHRKDLLTKGESHHFTVLLSGQNFQGATAGFAFVGEMCGFKSTGVVQHYPRTVSPATVGKIFAHELGHSLGAMHDSAPCSSGSKTRNMLMTGSNIENIHWSKCSQIYIAQNIDRFSCLLKEPRTYNRFPLCGNGILDPHEECDCGFPGFCVNHCCNPTTCKLKMNSTCASGKCCNMETCQFHPRATLCRRAISECDLSEYCSGLTTDCPSDLFKFNGAECDRGKGVCLDGMCKSRNIACQQFVSPSAVTVPSNYFDNLHWRIQQKPCEELLCLSHLLLFNEDSRKIINSQTSALYFTEIPVLKFSLTNATGFPCGINMTCVNHRCTPMDRKGQIGCLQDCSPNGVCNSAGRCHCDSNFAPPDCLYPGYGGSLDSGSSSPSQENLNLAIYVLFLGIVPFIVVTGCLLVNIRLVYQRKWKKAVNRRY